jgi:hypothetical protein
LSMSSSRKFRVVGSKSTRCIESKYLSLWEVALAADKIAFSGQSDNDKSGRASPPRRCVLFVACSARRLQIGFRRGLDLGVWDQPLQLTVAVTVSTATVTTLLLQTHSQRSQSPVNLRKVDDCDSDRGSSCIMMIIIMLEGMPSTLPPPRRQYLAWQVL